jgi:hypothetical protein
MEFINTYSQIYLPVNSSLYLLPYLVNPSTPQPLGWGLLSVPAGRQGLTLSGAFFLA